MFQIIKDDKVIGVYATLSEARQKARERGATMIAEQVNQATRYYFA